MLESREKSNVVFIFLDCVANYDKSDRLSQNVQGGVNGLSLSRKSLLENFELTWAPEQVHANEMDFRRLVYNLTNRPVKLTNESEGGWNLEGFVEGKKIKTKTKKKYNVSVCNRAAMLNAWLLFFIKI